MSLDDYKAVLYQNQPDGWVAEVSASPGCHALLPTRKAAPAELAAAFQVIAVEYVERGQSLPADTTAIVRAYARADDFRRVARKLGCSKSRQTGFHERWLHPDGRSTNMPVHRGQEIGPAVPPDQPTRN